MKVWVEKAVPLTTVQDLGRPGWAAFGVTPGGAADRFALRVANRLVGNAESTAGLELTYAGPDLHFEQEALVAVTGAAPAMRLDTQVVPPDRPVRVPPGSQLSVPGHFRGCRAWLAVAGGIDVPTWLGSRSTDIRAQQGGLAGRALATGDELATGPMSPQSRRWIDGLRRRGLFYPAWSVRLGSSQPAGRDWTVRAVRGPEWDWFDAESRDAFFGVGYEVTTETDRMGIRLEGPRLAAAASREAVSAAVIDGTVQVPGSGQPVVLLADRQTVGGYPRIAAVAQVDWGRLAQLRPGDRVRFAEVTVGAAHALALAREQDLKLAGIALEAWQL
jgi:antagonist of KipI